MSCNFIARRIPVFVSEGIRSRIGYPWRRNVIVARIAAALQKFAIPTFDREHRIQTGGRMKVMPDLDRDPISSQGGKVVEVVHGLCCPVTDRFSDRFVTQRHGGPDQRGPA